MATALAAQAQLIRSGSFFTPAANWTWFLQVKNGATTPATVFFRSYLSYGDPSSTHPYLALRSVAASNNIVLKTFDGTTTNTSATFTPTASVWAWIAATYVASTHTLTFYANSATPVGTLTVDLSAFTFVETTSAMGSTVAGTSFGDYSVGYGRQWQIVLTGAQLVLEAASKTPVQTGSLLTDTPLQTSVDLTAHNNTLTEWTATGTVTTDTTDALLTIVAAPPTNVDPSTATAITFDNAVIQDTLTTGAATSVFYKKTATADEVWSAIALGTIGGGYTPFMVVTDTTTSTTIVSSTANRGVQFPVTKNHVIGFEALRNGAVTPATVIVSVIKCLNRPIAAGSFAINDDTVGLPLIFLDHTQTYPIGWLLGTPAGEGLDALPSGIAAMLNDDDTGDTLQIINGQTVLSTVSLLPEVNYKRVSSDQQHTFYLGQSSFSGTAKARIITVSDGGTIGATTWGLPVSGMQALGVNTAGSLAYWCESNANNKAIRRFDLTNNIALTDLTAGIANYALGKDILVMADSTVVVMHAKGSATVDANLHHYAADGTLLHTVNFGSNLSSLGDIRLARALEDGHVWVWLHLSSPAGFDQFQRVRLSDGTVVETRPATSDGLNGPGAVQYETAKYVPTATDTPVRLGHSESCGFYLTRAAINPTEILTIRRQRRFLLPSSDRQARMQIPMLELLMRTGIGLLPDATDSATPLGVNPQVMFRLSKDGGQTWGPERWVSAGARGRFLNRVRLLQATGRYRNAVLEVTVSDPVDWQFLAMLGDPEEGSN